MQNAALKSYMSRIGLSTAEKYDSARVTEYIYLFREGIKHTPFSTALTKLHHVNDYVSSGGTLNKLLNDQTEFVFIFCYKHTICGLFGL